MAEDVQVPASYMLAACCATGSRIHQESAESREVCVLLAPLLAQQLVAFVVWITCGVLKTYCELFALLFGRNRYR